MASRGGEDMKGFYRQKKANTFKNPNKKPSRSSSSSSAKHDSPASTLASGVTQPNALVSHASPHLSVEHDEKEEVLRQFDMNMAYGPCLGMTRLARWERASKLGMNPPRDVEGLLKLSQARLECLWEGRV